MPLLETLPVYLQTHIPNSRTYCALCMLILQSESLLLSVSHWLFGILSINFIAVSRMLLINDDDGGDDAKRWR